LLCSASLLGSTGKRITNAVSYCDELHKLFLQQSINCLSLLNAEFRH